MTLDLLARAPAEALDVNALIVLVSVGVAAAAALLVAVPIVIAIRRRHRQREGLASVGVLWALVAATTVIWAINRDWSAKAERQRQIESGDVDPREAAPSPAQPWPLWGALGIAYAGLLFWSSRTEPGRAGP